MRGVLAGCQDFRFYSLTLVVQGVATLIPSVVLTLADGGYSRPVGAAHQTGGGAGPMLGYAFIFALAPLVAALSGLVSPVAAAVVAGDRCGGGRRFPGRRWFAGHDRLPGADAARR